MSYKLQHDPDVGGTAPAFITRRGTRPPRVMLGVLQPEERMGIKSCVTLACFLIVLSWSVQTATAQALSMAQVMTPAQLQATGVGSLSPAQRAALENWLQGYTIRVLQVAMSGAKPNTAGAGEYAATGPGHWVKKVSNGGR